MNEREEFSKMPFSRHIVCKVVDLVELYHDVVITLLD